MDLERALQLFSALDAEGVDYVLVGGVAMALHGLVRGTEDIDLFLRPDPSNVERLRAALRSIWDDANIDEITAQDLCGEYPTVRYGPPGEVFAIDLLTRLGTAFAFTDLDGEWVVVESVPVHVATPATLFRMKKDTPRDIDRADARALALAFGLRGD